MLMGFSTTVSTLRIRKRALDITTLLMVVDTQAGGLKESSMALGLLKTRIKGPSNTASGKLASVLNGSTIKRSNRSTATSSTLLNT